MFRPICRRRPSLFDSLLGITVKLAVAVSKLVHFSGFEHRGETFGKMQVHDKIL